MLENKQVLDRRQKKPKKLFLDSFLYTRLSDDATKNKDEKSRHKKTFHFSDTLGRAPDNQFTFSLERGHKPLETYFSIVRTMVSHLQPIKSIAAN